MNKKAFSYLGNFSNWYSKFRHSYQAAVGVAIIIIISVLSIIFNNPKILITTAPIIVIITIMHILTLRRITGTSGINEYKIVNKLAGSLVIGLSVYFLYILMSKDLLSGVPEETKSIVKLAMYVFIGGGIILGYSMYNNRIGN